MAFSARFFRVISSVVFLTACATESPLPSISQLLLTPSTVTIVAGQSTQLIAAVTTSPAGSSFKVSWTTADSASATVDSTGLVLGKAEAEVSICATATPDGGGSSMKRCATVFVMPTTSCPGLNGSLIPALDSIHVGDVVHFQIPAAQLAGRNAGEIRWTVDYPAVATIDSLTGALTATSVGGTDVIATDPLASSPCPHQWNAIVIVH
jgi:hypothetical protein